MILLLLSFKWEKYACYSTAVLDVQKNNEEYIIDANTASISHLDQGYAVALEAHVRTSPEHKLLFLRSLAAIPLVLLLLRSSSIN
jgi:hypothetical protein